MCKTLHEFQKSDRVLAIGIVWVVKLQAVDRFLNRFFVFVQMKILDCILVVHDYFTSINLFKPIKSIDISASSADVVLLIILQLLRYGKIFRLPS